MTIQQKTFEVTMSFEHLGASVQQHLRAFGYFNNDDQFFGLKKVLINKDSSVTLKGIMYNE